MTQPCGSGAGVLVYVLMLMMLSMVRGAAGGCGLAEFACRDGGCVRLDAYCDTQEDCADGSDEPHACTVCNRTYYGRAGVAYSLAVRDVPRVPFLCHLTFSAGGGAHGDLVQIAFDEFRVGRYEAGALDGCPEGYMQVSELGRPFTGGSWCGSAGTAGDDAGRAGGLALYYSETSILTVSVKLFRTRLGEPFTLKLRYKFLSQRDALVRFGGVESPVERGAVSPGTYCTRTYEECHRKSCRLQSPNYPGMYPRNVSCYWSLRQRDIPTCKHAMISIHQQYSHKMQIKRSISMASLNKTGRVVRAWRDCTGERDRLIVYDGGSTDDPVLVEYCGGDWLPRITARGPHMLVAFHSSPYSAPLRPTRPLTPLQGFELDVDVIFADSDSLDYAREARRCEFHVKASSSEEESKVTGTRSTRGRRGVLRAPTHTLPPNTTCTWTFHGRPGDLVWIYFSIYSHYSLVDGRRVEGGEQEEDSSDVTSPSLQRTPPPTQPRDAATCAVQLRVWDGGGEGESGAMLLGEYCDNTPALCARAALGNSTRTPRPCAPPDGYVSRAPELALAVHTRPGTATHPLTFSLHYEFVDARLQGDPLMDRVAMPLHCARLLTVPGSVHSPRNALLFGRGGAKSLHCVYRLQATGARIALDLHAVSFGREPRCLTREDPVSGRLSCSPTDDEVQTEVDVTHLKIYESPKLGIRVPVACLCDNTSAPLHIESASEALELELVGVALPADEDHRHLHFRGEWHLAPAVESSHPSCTERRTLPPPGQNVRLVYPYQHSWVSECGEMPFVLSARGNRSVFVRVWGSDLPVTATPPSAPASATAPGDTLLCHTANRILIYSAQDSKLVKAICPGVADGIGAGVVHVFSAEWWQGIGGVAGDTRGGEMPATLLLVWYATEPGEAQFSWMEVWRTGPAGGPTRFSEGGNGVAISTWPNATSACERACDQLAACMDPELWCDGWPDCPGGADEASDGCGAGARILAALRVGGAVGVAAAVGGCVALVAICVGVVAARRCRQRHKHLPLAFTTGTEGARRLTEELLYGSRTSSTTSS